MSDKRLELPVERWQRVSRRYIVVELVGYLLVGVVTVGGLSAAYWLTRWPIAWVPAASLGVVFLLVIVLTPRRVGAIGYRLRDDDLLFRRGLLFQRFVAVPYGRMQLIDINRGPLDRLVGLSELKFVTAAASTGITIPGLPQAEAEALRDRLVALAETRRAGL